MRYVFGFLCVCALGCGQAEPNEVWVAVCEATCERGFECFPEDGSVAQCVSACLGEVGNPPCDQNDAALDACVEGIGALSCEDLELGRAPDSCTNICTGNDLCDDVTCFDDGDECTDDVCSPIDATCSYPASADGTSCANGAGTCFEGNCRAEFPCTEEGVREAVAVMGGPHTFECHSPTTIATQSEIIIDRSVILDGEGNLTLDANDSHRVLHVRRNFVPTSRPVVAELRGMTFTGGRAEGGGISVGGGIWNEGTLTLTDCRISGNTASLGTEPVEEVGGGGIYGGNLTLERSTVSENRTIGLGADERGGGIYGGSATLIDSTVSGNTTGGNGGGIYLGVGKLVLINSTVSGNEAGVMGGGIVVRDELIMTNSTVSGNTANDSVNGVLADFGTVTVTSSTIAGDASVHGGVWTVTGTLIEGDCLFGVITSNGYNIESPGNTCSFDQSTDKTGVPDPMLGPLQNNGGPTETHALLPGSDAIDQISEAACEIDEDQRGVARPQGPSCDVGAFEVEVAP